MELTEAQHKETHCSVSEQLEKERIHANVAPQAAKLLNPTGKTYIHTFIFD